MTLMDVCIGAAIATVIAAVTINAASAASHQAQHVNASLTARAAMDRLSERLESEAAGAWSVFVPSTDVNGSANDDGHAVGFYTEDGAHRRYATQYVFDAGSHAVTRYRYDPAAPQDAAQSDRIGGITALRATGVAVTALFDPNASAYDALFARASAAEVSVPMPLAEAAGGNGLVSISIQAAAFSDNEMLASATAPSSFTVVIDYTPSPPPPAAPSSTPGPQTTPQP